MSTLLAHSAGVCAFKRTQEADLDITLVFFVEGKVVVIKVDTPM